MGELPLEIAIEITSRCSLNCIFCERKKSTENIPLESVKNLLDQIKELNIRKARFTGGEPFLHPQLAEIIRYAKDKGFSVGLNTNATVSFNDNMLKRLEDCLDTLLVSFQGYDAFSNKRLSGMSSGLWETKIKNIFKFNNSRIKSVILGTVISKPLISKWQSYCNLVRKFKIKHWWFFRPINSHKEPQYYLKRRDFLLFMDKLYRYNLEKAECSFIYTLPFCITEDIRVISSVLLSNVRNDDHPYQLVWDLKGYFKPSYFIDIKLGKTVKEALHHPYMLRRKDLQSISFCRRCIFLSRCSRGNRYCSKMASGDYFAPDPLVNYKNSLFFKKPA